MPALTITSRRHPLVSRCRDAADGREGEVLLDGPHLVSDALAALVPLHALLVAEGADRRDEIATLLVAAGRRGIDVHQVTPAVLDAASPTRTPSGIVALADVSLRDPHVLRNPDPALVTVAIGVQDPGNLGTLCRSSEAAGATGLLADAASAHPLGWKVLRGSMGSALRLPLARVDVVEPTLDAWRTGGLRVVALAAAGDTLLDDADLSGPIAICAGAEGAGLPASVLDLADQRIRVPMRAPVESLNVGVAVSLVLFEAARQRGYSR